MGVASLLPALVGLALSPLLPEEEVEEQHTYRHSTVPYGMALKLGGW